MPLFLDRLRDLPCFSTSYIAFFRDQSTPQSTPRSDLAPLDDTVDHAAPHPIVRHRLIVSHRAAFYSDDSTFTGSSAAARRAGMRAASVATSNSNIPIARNVSGSAALI